MAPRKGDKGYAEYITAQKARRQTAALQKKQADARRTLAAEINSRQQHIEQMQRRNTAQMHKVHRLERMLLLERTQAADESRRRARGAALLVKKLKAAQAALNDWKTWWAKEQKRRKKDKAQDVRSKQYGDGYLDSASW